ncbi:MAG: RluA family pseudouridine synthase [Pseudomonadota bacterium]
MAGVSQRKIEADEAGMRLDRWFKTHYPGVGFGHLQKLLRSGQVRVDGARAKSSTRLAAGQIVRVPPVGSDAERVAPLTHKTMRDRHDGDVIAANLLYEDDKVLVINKPAGLAVQGGSGLNRHVDGMLEAYRDRKGQKPRLVHRLDRDTSGVLVVARTRLAASFLTKAFRERTTKKVYWALVRGVPRPPQGRLSTFLIKDEDEYGDQKMRVILDKQKGADHAVTLYSAMEWVGQTLSWMSLRPVTGRMHQLRAHMDYLGHPIIGDKKYFSVENWELPGGIQNKLHLHARRLVIPHPDGGSIDVTAPLPPHMVQSWNLLGFDETTYDPVQNETVDQEGIE